MATSRAALRRAPSPALRNHSLTSLGFAMVVFASACADDSTNATGTGNVNPAATASSSGTATSSGTTGLGSTSALGTTTTIPGSSDSGASGPTGSSTSGPTSSTGNPESEGTEDSDDAGTSGNSSSDGADTTTTSADDSDTQNETADAEETEETGESGEVGDDDESGDDDGIDPQLDTPDLDLPAADAVDIPIVTKLCWKKITPSSTVRYRVYVDGRELGAGITGGQPGYGGSCTANLALRPDREYEWHVVAFDIYDHRIVSAPSERRRFRTESDGVSKIVLEEDFENGTGRDWVVSGDASEGHFEFGLPDRVVLSMASDEVSQPGSCGRGSDCLFTGMNRLGLADEGDLDGGSSVILSPEFDLSGMRSAVVGMARFVHADEAAAGHEVFKVELLRPDPDAPGEYLSHRLTRIDGPTQPDGHGTWHTMGVPVCNQPLGPGMRLRITATDPGDAVVEAAIDTITVTGFLDNARCEQGVGRHCDPDGVGCGDGMLCCATGSALETGQYSCQEPVRGLDFNNPPASPDDPGNGLLGCDAPDLTIEGDKIVTKISEIDVDADSCALAEACVDAPGLRKVLRFDTRVPNIGSRDLVMGVPANYPNLYHYSPCHGHYHLDGFAKYQLFDLFGRPVTRGRKQAFCLVDWRSWVPWPSGRKYGCRSQGLSQGYTDNYDMNTECQWVDITDVPPGDYVLRIEVNPPIADGDIRPLIEQSYDNNVFELRVTIPDDDDGGDED